MKTPRQSWSQALQRWLRLPSRDLWDFDPEPLHWAHRTIVRMLRVVQLVWRGYREDACKLHASALTYYTLMSIIPLLALGLALVRVFGGDAIVRERIHSEIARFGAQLSTHAQTANGAEAEMVTGFAAQLSRYADRILDQIGQLNFGTLGGIGLVVLLMMAISMLSQVEHSFNQVWSAPGRSLWRKCSDYLTMVIIVPFLALAATTLPVANFVARHLDGWVGTGWMAGWGGAVLRQGTTLLLTVALFVVVLMFVPNTRVRFRPALVGGFVTAVGFLAWLWICTRLQVGVIKYSKLYGSFAVIPILLAWVYTSWQILLFGAELSFACQHASTYVREQGARRAGCRARMQLALAITAEMARAMQMGEGSFPALDFAKRHGISVRLLNDVLDDLQQAGLIIGIGSEGQEGSYVLLHDPSRLTAATVAQSVLDRGETPEAVGLGQLDPALREYIGKAEETWTASLAQPVACLLSAPGKDGGAGTT
jgi:membrane protein